MLEGAHPDGGLQVVAEDKEGAAVGEEAAREEDAVFDAPGQELADSVGEVLPGPVLGREAPASLEVGLEGAGDVGRPADEAGVDAAKEIQVAPGSVPGSLLFLQLELIAGRDEALPSQERRKDNGLFGMFLFVSLEGTVLLEEGEVSPLGEGLGEALVSFLLHREGRIGVAELFLGLRAHLEAEGRAVHLVGALKLAPVADRSVDDDEARGLVLLERHGFLDGIVDGPEVVAVIHLVDIPARGFEAEGDVLDERHRGRVVEGRAVGVVDESQVVELLEAGEGDGLLGEPFLEAAVPAKGVDPVREIALAPGEAGLEGLLGHRHPDSLGKALPERSARGVDPGGQPPFRMARALAPELAEPLKFLEREVVAGKMEHRVKEGAHVPGAQDEAVAARMKGARRVAHEEVPVKDIEGRGDVEGHAGVAAIGRVDLVEGEGP